MPWTLSTGPLTAEGKSRSRLNGWKGGVRREAMRWREALRQLKAGMEKALARAKVISPVCRKRRLNHAPKKLPLAWSLTGWNDGEDDGVDQMSDAEVAEACHRLFKLKGGSAPG